MAGNGNQIENPLWAAADELRGIISARLMDRKERRIYEKG